MSEENSSFLGNASHPDFGEQPLSGKITITSACLQFESAAATVEFSVKQMEVEVDEEEQRVIFRHPGFPEWTIVASNLEILEHRVFRQNPNLKRQVGYFLEGKEGAQRLKVTVMALLVFAVVSVTGLVLAGSAVGFALKRLPPSVDNALGDSVFEKLKNRVDLVEDAELEKRLTELVNRLTSAQPQNKFMFKVQIVDDSTPNAAAIPGGRIFVNRGLLSLEPTAEELAGVLAHEMGHVNRRHGTRSLLTQVGPYHLLDFIFGRSDSSIAALAGGSTVLIGMSFSRESEREADDSGWQYLLAAGIDPRGLESFLEKLRQNSGGFTPAKALSTHPPTDERIQRLAKKWDELKEKPDFKPLDSAWIKTYLNDPSHRSEGSKPKPNRVRKPRDAADQN